MAPRADTRQSETIPLSSSDPYHVPSRLRARAQEITARTDAIAREHLDDEYAELARRMTATLARKRPAPIERGEARSWAAAILHAVGWVNFLTDPSREPHLTTKQLAAAADVGPSTVDRLFRTIRDALDLFPMHPEWTRPSELLDNPLAWMARVGDFVFDLREAPREVQEEAFREGLIPFVPGERMKSVPAHDQVMRSVPVEDHEGLIPFPGQRTESIPADDEELDLFASGAAANVPGPEVLAEIQELLNRTLDENPDVTLDQLNAALAGAAGDYNQRPQDELGGLSPQQVQALISADWQAGDGVVQLEESLLPVELENAPLLQYARLLMSMLAERGRVKATPKGNLPREFVREFRDRMRSPDVWDGMYARIEVLNEQDLFPLYLTRALLRLAGIVRFANRSFHLTKNGVALADGDRQGALFAALFRTHFRKLNLAWLDRGPQVMGLQDLIAFTLYQFGQVAGEWHKPEELVGTMLLPIVRDAIPPRPSLPGFDEAALILEIRVLRPLVRFGLAEGREPARGPGLPYERAAYRKAPLFDRFFSVDLGGR